MTLYPRSSVRAAFAAITVLCEFRRSSEWEAYDECGSELSLNWDFEARRWRVLRWDFNVGSDWFSDLLVAEANCPN